MQELKAAAPENAPMIPFPIWFERAAAAPAAPQITAPQSPPPLYPPAAAPAAVDMTTPMSSPGPVAVFA